MTKILNTAIGSGYYRVFVNGGQISQHIAEREAAESATNAKLTDPSRVVTYTHDYIVRVDLDTVSPTPTPDPQPTPEPTPEPEPTPNPTPQPTPDPGPSGTNEPSGFVTIADNPFNETSPAGWTHYTTVDWSNLTWTIISDTTAPRSPNSVGQVHYETNYTDGSDIMKLVVPNFNSSKVYFRSWIKVSPNWQGHDSGTNKIGFLTATGTGNAGDPIIFKLDGITNGMLSPAINRQGHEDGGVAFKWNGSTSNVFSNYANPTAQQAEVVRNTWNDIEWLIDGGTAGNNDGSIKVWLNGVLILDYRNVGLFNTGAPSRFNSLRIEPIWGGNSNDVLNQEQFMYFDHFYASVESGG